ncbi:MAG: large subunit ribosomal protein [Patescibacteria group bacterium]|jgi:large subunit ribosomal protein L18|nr:large subunit ribosomal protein [Patescibacteria group bacterium]
MKDHNKVKQAKYLRRQIRTRAKMSGTAKKPRLTVFRSLSHIYAQAIDDAKGVTIAAAADTELTVKGKKIEKALALGELLGKKLADKKISEIIFDRGAYKYHGRVKSLADGLRKAGIKF